MSDFFDDFFNTDWTPRFTNATPAINVKEDKQRFTLEIAVPGLKKEYCRVNLDNDGILSVELPKLTPQETALLTQDIEIQ